MSDAQSANLPVTVPYRAYLGSGKTTLAQPASVSE